jgi:hypothetical protein
VQVCKPAHDQARQEADLLPAGACHGDGQSADRGGPVDHGEDPAVPAHLVEQLPQPGIGVG